MERLKIPWYNNDPRFAKGTVADVGDSIRLKLRDITESEYRLYLGVRINRRDNVRDDLRRPALVAKFKKCDSLEEAQDRASEWLAKWLLSMMNDTNFFKLLNQWRVDDVREDTGRDR